MDDLDLIVDLHLRNERQGPGSAEETRRALGLCRLAPGRPVAVADIGCGTGASAFVLAESLEARVTAIDAMPRFIDDVRTRAATRSIASAIDAKVGDMADLPFEDASLDLMWSEGAIYNIGFAEGVLAWRRFLKPGGVLAVTELSWTTPTRPADIEAYWHSQYPGIGTLPSNIAALEAAGYRMLAAFFLPQSCWDAYLGPLRTGFEPFLARHDHSEQARSIVEAEQREMELHSSHGQWFNYAFYIASRDENAGHPRPELALRA